MELADYHAKVSQYVSQYEEETTTAATNSQNHPVTALQKKRDYTHTNFCKLHAFAGLGLSTAAHPHTHMETTWRPPALVYHRNHAIVKIKRAGIHRQNEIGESPVDRAASRMHYECVELLEQLGWRDMRMIVV